MPTNADVSIVRNVSGVEMYFDFLGPRGATLASGDDLAVPGDILTMWFRNPQKQAALEYALVNNKIEILKTPDVFAYDETDSQVYVLGFDNGAPVAVDPDYGSYAGDPPDV